MIKYALEMEQITKSFLGAVVNENICFKVREGEVHALLGENGAGKSTLMNILIGLYKPNSGSIKIKGTTVSINSPRDAIKLGIGMVHQHFKLVDTLTVAENVILGWYKPKYYINKKKLEDEIEEIAKQHDISVHPGASVYQISAGERQRLEILKVLYRGANILILDEPTSVLTEPEAKDLFRNIRNLTRSGKTIIFISHKLNEVMEVADRITVLRKGKFVTTLDKEATNPRELIQLMSGKETISFSKQLRPLSDNAPSVMSVKEVSVLGDLGEISVHDASFEVKRGEILGIAGIAGNGQSDLAKVITGMKQPLKGKIVVNELDLSKATARKFIDAGIGHIPEDRIKMGAIPNFNCIENVILKKYTKPPIRQGFLINRKSVFKNALHLIKNYDIRVDNPQTAIRLLSGGNLQKLILAREISFGPKVLVAVHPTYGLDVSATNMVHNYLLEAKEKGMSIILISENLDEIMALSESICVMFKGRLSRKRCREGITTEEITYMMMGIQEERSRELC